MPNLTLNYLFSFSGRISRKEYWLYFTLPVFVLEVLAQLCAKSAITVLPIVGIVLMLVAVVLSLAAGIRRFHDRDKSGLWMLICLIPIIGALWIFVELGFLRGTAGPNKFGADPASTVIL